MKCNTCVYMYTGTYALYVHVQSYYGRTHINVQYYLTVFNGACTITVYMPGPFGRLSI